MEIRKSPSRIWAEKLEKIKKKIQDAGFWVKEIRQRKLNIQRKKGIFQLQYRFEFDDINNILELKNGYISEDEKEFCRELERKAKVKIVIYLD